LSLVVLKNATQSTVKRMNNKRKYVHQKLANARKHVFKQMFFDTRLHKKGAWVLHVRRPPISDLYCSFSSFLSCFIILHKVGLLLL